MSLYVNGALDQQAAANITPWDSGCPFHLGGIYDPSGDCAYTGQFFNGLIDEATVYSAGAHRERRPALYNAGEMRQVQQPRLLARVLFRPRLLERNLCDRGRPTLTETAPTTFRSF